MIEHKYLKLLYRFCKENNIANFLPKTFDEDIKKIKNKAILNNKLVIEVDRFYSSSKTCNKCAMLTSMQRQI